MVFSLEDEIIPKKIMLQLKIIAVPSKTSVDSWNMNIAIYLFQSNFFNYISIFPTKEVIMEYSISKKFREENNVNMV
jgi:hypothetical protein